MAGLDAIDIGRDRDDPVRVVAGEVGIDAAVRDGVCFLVRGAGSPEERRTDAGKTVGLDDRHGVPVAMPARGRILLVVTPRMVSKRRPDGNDLGRNFCPDEIRHGRIAM